MNIWKRRDLTIVDREKECLVIACDSSGGVGLKEHDALNAPYTMVGACAARVVLMEVLSTGAEVISLTNAVCNEMNDTGIEIMKGVRRELAKANVTIEVLNGSTEENFATSMTAVAVTAIGVVPKGRLRLGGCAKGDRLIRVGLPKFGAELLLNEEMAQYEDVSVLLQSKDVKEIVPVGSKGILHEAEGLANLHGVRFVPLDTELNFHKSAGPATCLIAVVSEAYVSSYSIIGRFD